MKLKISKVPRPANRIRNTKKKKKLIEFKYSTHTHKLIRGDLQMTIAGDHMTASIIILHVPLNAAAVYMHQFI